MVEGVGYELKITQIRGTEIYIDTKHISSVEFFVDTIDENVKDRSENVLTKVTVKGTISEEVKSATKDLLLWSLAKKKEDVYRSVEITIRINETSRVRKYKMDNVFCLDYKETFFNGGENSEYELKFSQRKDDIEGISVIC